MMKSSDTVGSSLGVPSQHSVTHRAWSVKDYAEQVYERAIVSERHKDDCEAAAYDARRTAYAIYNSTTQVGDASEEAQYVLGEINKILTRLDAVLVHIAKPGRFLTIRRKRDELELQKIKTNLSLLKLEIGISRAGCRTILRAAGRSYSDVNSA